MNIKRLNQNAEPACERVLRSLPAWFGQEDSVQEYVRDTTILPTWVVVDEGEVLAFIIVKAHSEESYEIHCMAVLAQRRGQGIGRLLVETACNWVREQGGQFVQVKTIAQSVVSPEYAETRQFYARMGFVCLEVHPTLWSEIHPCLQLIRTV